MPIELARVKLRGLYAIAAGLFLLVGIPYFEGAVLAPTGYFTAVDQVTRGGGFAPLLAWASQQPGLDLTFHIVELVPFLLVIALPVSLRRALWPRVSRVGRVAALSGLVGFGLYGLAVVIGAFATRSAADAFARETQFQAQTAAGYAGQYAFQTLMSHVLGGLLVGLCMLLVGARIVRSRLLPRWLGFVSIVPAGFLALTAVQFLAAPTQVETATSSLTFVLLALWLIATGVSVARLRGLTDAETAPSDDAPASSETGAGDGVSDTASQANPRSDVVTDRLQ